MNVSDLKISIQQLSALILCNQILMLNTFQRNSQTKKIMDIPEYMQYDIKQYNYSICFAQGSLIIRISDFSIMDHHCLKITDLMASTKNTTLKILHQYIYKQYIYDNKVPRHLLKIQGKTINLNFNYQCCAKKSLTFECNLQSFDKSPLLEQNNQELTKKIEQKIYNYFVAFTRKYESSLNIKMMEFNEKIEIILSRQESSNKNLLNESKQQFQQWLQKHKRESINDLKDKSHLLANEFKFALTELSKQIFTLNSNIQVLSSQLKEIKNVVQENYDAVSDQFEMMEKKLFTELHKVDYRRYVVKEKAGAKNISERQGNFITKKLSSNEDSYQSGTVKKLGGYSEEEDERSAHNSRSRPSKDKQKNAIQSKFKTPKKTGKQSRKSNSLTSQNIQGQLSNLFISNLSQN